MHLPEKIKLRRVVMSVSGLNVSTEIEPENEGQIVNV